MLYVLLSGASENRLAASSPGQLFKYLKMMLISLFLPAKYVQVSQSFLVEFCFRGLCLPGPLLWIPCCLLQPTGHYFATSCSPREKDEEENPRLSRYMLLEVLPCCHGKGKRPDCLVVRHMSAASLSLTCQGQCLRITECNEDTRVRGLGAIIPKYRVEGFAIDPFWRKKEHENRAGFPKDFRSCIPKR